MTKQKENSIHILHQVMFPNSSLRILHTDKKFLFKETKYMKKLGDKKKYNLDEGDNIS